MRSLDARVVVVGSGPGGAATACLLAEAGRDVLLLEEGDAWPPGSAPAYSLREMDQKWRNGGLTLSFGPVKVTYVEGRCLGGASEVNAGLYHPPVPEYFDTHARASGIESFDAASMAPHIEWVEREVGVAPFPGSAGRASERLAAGAASLGWKSVQVQRFWRYDDASGPAGRRRSMTETLIPRARAAGARVETGIRVRRIDTRGGRVVGVRGVDRDGAPVLVRCEHVFVCAGAVQTALVLRRSGFRAGVGDTLTMNPMIRLAAEFADRINEPDLGVPVQQIEAFKPQMTLGCSHGSVAHLALWLVGPPEQRDRILAEWWRYGVFYAKVMAKARGKVRNVPFTDEAFVQYALTRDDLSLLGLAAERLATVLFASGALSLVSPVAGDAPIRGVEDIPRLRAGVEAGRAQLSAIHLHSTVPLGGPVDAWGKLRATEGVWVNDSSLLPDTPGVNPQGTILAIAHRNAARYLGA